MGSAAASVGLDGTGKRRLAIAAAILTALATVGLGVPELTRRSVQAAQGGDVAAIWPLAVAGVGVAVVFAVLEYGSRVAKQVTQNGLERDLQSRVLVKALRLPKRRIAEGGEGAVVTHVMDDVPTFAQGHVAAYSGLVLGGATLVAGLAYCVILNPVLAVATVAFNVVFRLATRRVDRMISGISAELRSVRERTNALLADLVGIKDIVQVYRRQDWATERLRGSQDEERTARNREFAWSNGYSDAQWAIKKLAEVVIIFGVGGILAMRGLVEISALIAFIPASDYLYKGFSALLDYWIVQARVAPAKRSIADFLSQDDDVDGHLVHGDGSVEFDRVSFSFGDRLVLDQVSFRIEPGDWVEIRGPNGAGKSTLVALMLGLLQPDSGTIRHGVGDGAVVYVPQATPVFTGDALTNIALGDQRAHARAGQHAADLGLGHRADAEAMQFSTGETRRIGVARALARLPESRLLVGDEITAGLDADNRSRVLDLLRAHAGDATVVLIEHDELALPFSCRLTVAGGKVEVMRRETP